MIKGKPNIAMRAAFCWALAAIAAIKVNTKVRLKPPRAEIAMNLNDSSGALPNKTENNKRLMQVSSNIRIELYISFDKIK